MDIRGKNVLVLGGHGLVGMAVCRAILRHDPAVLVVGSRRRSNADEGVASLRVEYPDAAGRIEAAWGDVFLRAEWRDAGADPRARVLEDAERRSRLIADILDPLDGEILHSSLLARFIMGLEPGPSGRSAHIVVDCLNTATAVSYQNVYDLARGLRHLPAGERDERIERLLASLYVPQLVRHVQILFEAMRQAETEAYVKVGTTGTGGMGFNIPYTHGEEKPSRLLLSKAAMAGAQTMLTYLMARTPQGPTVVKEIKPAALIGWKEIGYGAVRVRGREIALYDCPPEHAVLIGDPASLAPEGDFGVDQNAILEGVYIDTGENGQFSAGEFEAITGPGQMELVTPEEIARDVVGEILGSGTGHDVLSAVHGAIMAPTFRGGYLREAALARLRQLERAHGESVAFEVLGPPRLSKLLFEAFLLKRVYGTMTAALAPGSGEIAQVAEAGILADADLRRRAVSIGIPVLLADGERLLRGPIVKSATARMGWIDLTPANMATWQRRFREIRGLLHREREVDASSRHDRILKTSRDATGDDEIRIGECAAWILRYEERGGRYGES